MKNNSGIIHNLIVCIGLLTALSAVQANAQSGVGTAPTTQGKIVPARITEAINDAKTVVLKGNVHPLARPEFDRGAASDTTSLTRALLLLQRSDTQEATLRQLMEQQQDKSSPNFHKWLTPEQFGAQFGPADADIQIVTQWLSSQGFQNIKIGPGRTVIEFTGDAGQVRSAFHTSIHQFMVRGELHNANVSDPQIPAALAPVVKGVMGLHDFRHKSFRHVAQNFHRDHAVATRNARSVTFSAGCGTTGNQPCYGVAPADFATIYNITAPPANAGSGVTIAVVQDSNVVLSDIQQFRALFNLSNNFTATNVILNGPDPGPQGSNSQTGDEGEADLDVEWAGAVAPAATIDLVVSQTPGTLGADGIDLSAVYIIDNNLAPIMSESFGVCETGSGVSAFYTALWEQAAAQGITVAVSTGDSGSDVCDNGTSSDFATTGVSVSGLASTPFNVAVGGTDFQNGTPPSVFWNAPGTATESAKSYIPESTWNSSCATTAVVGSLATCTAALINADTFFLDVTAGSGGQSAIPTNTKPVWQNGVTPGADTLRDIPDISLYSAVNTNNNSFYITCEADSQSQSGDACSLGQNVAITPVGGTSAAAPAFAGIMAQVVQAHGRQGNANFVLYQLFKNNMANATKVCTSNAANTAVGPTGTCIFYDVVTGNISVACAGGSTNCSNTSATANQFGVLVDPAAPTTPAYTAVAGYDKATGLGSVNVANLLTAWSSATFTSDNVAITSSPASALAHGANATFTVQVTGTGTPTGNIALLASPLGSAPTEIGSFTNDTNSSFTLSGGTATITTNLLPGGTNYPVVAQYSGDGTFAAKTSAPVNVTVSKESSKTAVSLEGPTTNSTPYGSTYILRIDVTNSSSQQCSQIAVPCPTGQVSMTDNGAALNDFTSASNPTSNAASLLNDLGFFEDQLIQLNAGTHSIVATYAGDSSYTASTSPAVSLTITKAATATQVSSNVTTVASGGSVTLTAVVNTQSNGAGPTGTVQFVRGSANLGAAATCVPTAATNTVAASCTATLTTTLSMLAPPTIPQQLPRIPAMPLWIVVVSLLLLFVLAQRYLPARARGYAFASITLFALLTLGISGCGGGGGTTGGGGGGGTTPSSIKATYSGDGNYTGSTSTAITITVQ